MRISKGIKPHARKVLIHGQQGVGKSRVIATFPGCIMIDIERGTRSFDCNRNEDPILTYKDYQDCIAFLAFENHGYTTAGIDSFTRLNELICADLCQRYSTASIGEIGGGFGRGEKLLLAEWQNVKTGLDTLVARGTAVVIAAHTSVSKITTPDATYLEYTPDLPHSDTCNVRDMICRWCDEVFFMQQESAVKQEKGAFGAARGVKVVTGNNRTFTTCDTGGVSAKHRLGYMPPVINADNAQTYISYVLKLQQSAAPVTVTEAKKPEAEPAMSEAEKELINQFEGAS